MATIFLSTLDATDNSMIQATFSGAKTPLPTTSVPKVPTSNAGNILRSSLAAALKFKTNPANGTANTPINIIDSLTSNITGFPKTVMTPSNCIGVNQSLGFNTAANQNFLGQLAKEVFGSKLAGDLFNNQLTLSQRYVESCSSLNNTIRDMTGTNASVEIVNALMLEKSERFALDYRIGYEYGTNADAGIHRAVMFKGSVSGVSKPVTVEIGADNTTITSIIKESDGSFMSTHPDTLAAIQSSAGGAELVPNTYTNISLTTTTGNGTGAEFRIVATNRSNANITTVNVITPGSGYAIGDTVTIPAGSLGTGSFAITITLTSNMINGSALQSHADMVAEFKTVGGGILTLVAGDYTNIPSTSIHLPGKNSKLSVVVTGTVASSISSITFTNNGSGYRANDTVTIPAGTLGNTSTALSFQITDRMLLASGGISLVSQALLASVQNATGDGTTLIANGSAYSSGVTSTNGLGSGATFSILVGGNSASSISSFSATNSGSGYKIGDTITIGANALGAGSNQITFTITNGITTNFVPEDIITSIAGPGGSLGGIGGANALSTLTVTGSNTINSVQMAILNGTLHESTEVPLEINDIIQIKYQINSHTGQKDASGSNISMIYNSIFEFALIA
jgi:hypothetical protein